MRVLNWYINIIWYLCKLKQKVPPLYRFLPPNIKVLKTLRN